MSLLFVILGDKLDLEVTLVLVPSHVFVRYTDKETGMTYNLETTNKAQFSDNSYYMKHSPMTQRAIDNGVYLASLRKQEIVAVMAATLNEYYVYTHQYLDVIDLSALVLAYHPNNVSAILNRGNAYYGLQQEALHIYGPPNEITPKQMQYINHLGYLNQKIGAQAEALGWQEKTPEERSHYFETVKQYAKQQSQSNRMELMPTLNDHKWE